MENKQYLIYGVSFILLAIILGAFGAHALKEVLEPNQLNSFETGVRYQMYHGLAFLALVSLSEKKIALKKISLSLLFWGVCLFSGSIYLLALQDVIGVSLKFIGPITPLGGLLMIIGWAIVLMNIIQTKK